MSAIPDPSSNLALQDLARERSLRTIAVPTNDLDVRAALRKLEEPITLFGEDPALRRDRLRRLTLAKREAEADEDAADVDMADEEDEDKAEPQEEFYTEAGEELLSVRKEIARYSLKRSARAVAYQKSVEENFKIEDHREVRNSVKERLKKFELSGSQTAPRPVSAVRFPDGRTNPRPDIVAAGDWSGEVRILSIPDLETKRTLRGHKAQVRGLAWYPRSPGSLNGTASNCPLDLATGGSEGNIHLWSLHPSDPDVNMDAPTADNTTDVQPLTTLTPPQDPQSPTHAIRSIAFHPSSAYLAAAAEDNMFHLYSLHNPPTIPAFSSPPPPLDPMPLATYDPHALPSHTLSFSPSGSLLLSAGADAHGRIWDLRTGRTIMLLSGHMREIHSSSWAPDGYRVITGAADGLGMLWDVRMVRETGRLPLHQRGVTDVRWWSGDGSEGVLAAMEGRLGDASTEEKQTPAKAGTYVVSCGFDREVAFTSPDDGVPVRRLQGHNGHVLSVDVSGEGSWVVSGGYDRTVKLWGIG